MDHTVRFLDLGLREPELTRVCSIIREVLASGILVGGEIVKRFEESVARRVCATYAVGVGSGSDALYLALRAAGVGAGDEVITTSLSWIATANAIALAGATPVFADIGPDLNISPVSVERMITKKTRAVVAVDYAGLLCDYSALRTICDSHGLLLVQDSSQAFGATRGAFTCANGGRVAAISHNVMKVLAAVGDAGSVFTSSPDIRDRVLALRYNGVINKEVCIEPGPNARLDPIQAAVLLDRLERVASIIHKRNQNAAFYANNLVESVQLPDVSPGALHAYYSFVILVERRDELIHWLDRLGIEARIQHRILMCDQSPFAGCARDAIFAKKITGRLLSIPIHEHLTTDELVRVQDAIKKFYSR
jgi:dTDP-4-amino-4,6-dideoxygalactose transaminase